VRQWIGVIRHVYHARSARHVAAGSGTTGCHTGVIEGSRGGEVERGMAGAAIRIRRDVRERAELGFAHRDAVVVALHTLMSGHFRTRVIERSTGKRRCRRRIPRVTGDAIA